MAGSERRPVCMERRLRRHQSIARRGHPQARVEPCGLRYAAEIAHNRPVITGVEIHGWKCPRVVAFERPPPTGEEVTPMLRTNRPETQPIGNGEPFPVSAASDDMNDGTMHEYPFVSI